MDDLILGWGHWKKLWLPSGWLKTYNNAN